MNNIDKKIRVNRYLSLCGLGSRRKVEEYILYKRIKINGKVIHSLSVTIDVEHDIIEFDNKKINLIKQSYYIILNKPKGYITTFDDERNRPIIMDLIPEKYKRARLSPVGRLDKDSEGLLLLTNDGDLAYKLTHPKFGIEKEYQVELNKPLSENDKTRIEKGIYLYGSKTNPSKIDILNRANTFLKITINEGKKRHIRLTFGKFSYNVKKLKRISFGPLQLGKLESGSFRLLKNSEIKKLRQATIN